MELESVFFTLWGGLGFILGACLGSFSTALIWRIPRGIPWAIDKKSQAVRSICTSCETRLQPLDLIPLLSWTLNKGRCRHCNQCVSYRYPLFELGFAILTAFVFLMVGINLNAIIWSLFLTFVGIFLWTGIVNKHWAMGILCISLI